MRTTSLDSDLLAQLWRVAQETSRYNNAMMNENVEHSAAAIAVLRVVASGKARTPTHVADALACSRANAGKLINRLAVTRHLERHRHPTDARAISLRITPYGIDALRSGELQLAQDAQRWFARLHDVEKFQLLGLLQKL
jgi:DNA-binding MarR family transcriptional regulator